MVFNFLKKSRGDAKLDIPPPPPDLPEGLPHDLPEFKSLDEPELSLPPIEEEQPIQKMEVEDLGGHPLEAPIPKKEEEMQAAEESLPPRIDKPLEIKGIEPEEEIEEIDLPEIPSWEPPATAEAPLEPPEISIKPMEAPPEPVKVPVREEPAEDMEEVSRTLYLQLNEYKKVLAHIDDCEKLLKKTTAIVNKLNHVEKQKEESFEHWRNKLDAIQKKLMFVDKTLFELS